MNIHPQDVHVTLVISPTDLRCGYHRLHSIAQDQLGIDLNGGKESVVFISKTRRLCKIITSDNQGTLLLTRTLHHGRFKELDFFEINVEKFSNFRWFFSKPLAS